MIKKILLTYSLLFTLIVFSQNTVGVITNTSGAYNGYTLFTSHKKTFLINNCGQVIQQWISDFIPGNSVYLLENGNQILPKEKIFEAVWNESFIHGDKTLIMHIGNLRKKLELNPNKPEIIETFRGIGYRLKR